MIVPRGEVDWEITVGRKTVLEYFLMIEGFDYDALCGVLFCEDASVEFDFIKKCIPVLGRKL